MRMMKDGYGFSATPPFPYHIYLAVQNAQKQRDLRDATMFYVHYVEQIYAKKEKSRKFY